MKATLYGDVYYRIMENSLLLLLTKNSVVRGSEGKYLNIKNFKYNIFCDCLDTLWIEILVVPLCPKQESTYNFNTPCSWLFLCF